MALLVAHGLGRTADEWLPCARAIDVDAIVPDLAELRVVDRKPDVGSVIATLLAVAPPDAAWLGHSGGAHVMLEAAVAHPTRVRKLVLVGAAPSRALVARLACPLLVVESATHDPHLDEPSELVRRVRAFLYASV